MHNLVALYVLHSLQELGVPDLWTQPVMPGIQAKKVVPGMVEVQMMIAKLGMVVQEQWNRKKFAEYQQEQVDHDAAVQAGLDAAPVARLIERTQRSGLWQVLL